MDFLNRLKATIEKPILLKHAITVVAALVIGNFFLGLVTDTFDPGLMNEQGDYVGNPPLLILGCIGILVCTGVGFYSFTKWRYGAASDRANDALVAAQRDLNVDYDPTPASIVEKKLNISQRDEYFYDSAINNFITDISTVNEAGKSGKEDIVWHSITSLASLSSTHAYMHKILSNDYLMLIADAQRLYEMNRLGEGVDQTLLNHYQSLFNKLQNF